MGQKNIAVGGSRDMQGHKPTSELIIRPAVDIFETDQGLTLVADLPGVIKEDLSIDIDQELLTIEANAKSQLKGDPVLREFLHGTFYRQFQLPDEIDSGKISAELKRGVLTLNLPKSEAAKPRRIEITTA